MDVNSRTQQLLDANWGRMRRDIERASTEFRRTAELLDAIDFDSLQGERRAPEAIISQAALVMNTRADSDLIHRLALWAESINELLRDGV
jgi:hypothetical protein